MNVHKEVHPQYKRCHSRIELYRSAISIFMALHPTPSSKQGEDEVGGGGKSFVMRNIKWIFTARQGGSGRENEIFPLFST